MTRHFRALLGATALCSMAIGASAETLTIATVNNGDMIRMQGLSKDFTDKTRALAGDGVTRNGSRLRKTCCASASPPTSPPKAASST
jgi:sorbitol/mannitol transport system substrate-binding protein